MKHFLLALALRLTAGSGPAMAQTVPEPVRKTSTGMLISGNVPEVRALAPFGGKPENGIAYAEALNAYASVLGKGVRIYSLLAPTSIAYYCPETAKSWTRDEKAAIEVINLHLSGNVIKVDVYQTLAIHVHEPIYLRTDHHWAPLAAFYAAREFARIAGVPFKSLQDYERKVVKNFVGSMYHYSRDITVKESPEDFVYYVPRDSNYTATYIKYKLGAGNKVTGESAPETDRFFLHYKDGSPSAYCTFMGGDSRTVSIHTTTAGNRRLLIMKDSYGNAIPGYLFASFEDIYVVDFRYFSGNIVNYVKRHHITDVLFVNNLNHAYSSRTSRAYQNLLTTDKQ